MIEGQISWKRLNSYKLGGFVCFRYLFPYLSPTLFSLYCVFTQSSSLSTFTCPYLYISIHLIYILSYFLQNLFKSNFALLWSCFSVSFKPVFLFSTFLLTTVSSLLSSSSTVCVLLFSLHLPFHTHAHTISLCLTHLHSHSNLSHTHTLSRTHTHTLSRTNTLKLAQTNSFLTFPFSFQKILLWDPPFTLSSKAQFSNKLLLLMRLH